MWKCEYRHRPFDKLRVNSTKIPFGGVVAGRDTSSAGEFGNRGDTIFQIISLEVGNALLHTAGHTCTATNAVRRKCVAVSVVLIGIRHRGPRNRGRRMRDGCRVRVIVYLPARGRWGESSCNVRLAIFTKTRRGQESLAE